MIIEICTTSLSSIVNAQNAGANRVELCENYHVGGVTPNIEFFEKSLEVSKIPINVLIRPRGGDFIFNNKELDIMFASIQKFKNYDICGFFIVFLDNKKILSITFLNEFRRMYDEADNGIFKLIEWHDSFVFGHVLEKFKSQDNNYFDYSQNIYNKTAKTGGGGHPLINSVLGNYFDHMKGARKTLGKSKRSDLINIRGEKYWNEI